MRLPYVILKSAMSIDGYIDDSSSERLLFSNEADFERVDRIRSECDAILVGAGTLRADNPSLLVKSPELQQNRINQGLPEQPTKVTLTESGVLSSDSKFFTTGAGRKIVFCLLNVSKKLTLQFASMPTVDILALAELSPCAVLTVLADQGIKQLLIEGGTRIATSFLADDLVDELQISIAPFFVGQERASRLLNPQSFPHNCKNPIHLRSVEQLGDIVLLTYFIDRQRDRASFD